MYMYMYLKDMCRHQCGRACMHAVARACMKAGPGSYKIQLYTHVLVVLVILVLVQNYFSTHCIASCVIYATCILNLATATHVVASTCTTGVVCS